MTCKNEYVRDHPTRKNVVLGGGNGCVDCVFYGNCQHRKERSNFELDMLDGSPVVRCKRKKYLEENKFKGSRIRRKGINAEELGKLKACCLAFPPAGAEEISKLIEAYEKLQAEHKSIKDLLGRDRYQKALEIGVQALTMISEGCEPPTDNVATEALSRMREITNPPDET